ncbi:hypothetical protein PILCRDRAFT_86735 [Piloderma croceum F 1598]|uniref:RING-type domain-containing protein n=1 Tax=Piloderma croceum (strain F 1598) TaxID=765440 RepID=A0A0C3G2P6_PILCF|nr:hypothetical protein PILCRDRAFT_86735 [Piloderma croceum F 1598]
MTSSTIHTSLTLGSYAISAALRVAVSLASKAIIAGSYVVNLTLLAAAVAYQAAFFLLLYTISVLSHLYLIFASCALSVASFTTALVSGAITLAFSLLATVVPYVIAAVSFVITSAFNAGKTLKSNAISSIPYIIKAVMLLLSWLVDALRRGQMTLEVVIRSSCLGAVWFIKMIAHGIEVISNSNAVIEILATLVGHSLLIWLCIIIINQRRGIAVALESMSETWSPFVVRLRAIRDSFLLIPTALSIGPRHTTRKEHSLSHHSFEVSHDTNGLVNPTQGAGREIMLQNAIAGSSRFTPYQNWQRAILAARQQQELAEDIMRLFACRICLDMPPDDSICLEPCRHDFCRECIKGHIDTKLDERTFPVLCPVCMTGSVSGDPGVITIDVARQVGITEQQSRIWDELEIAPFSTVLHCRG